MQLTFYRAVRIHEAAGEFSCEVDKVPFDQLPAGDVLINVHYSSLNYKDALSAQGHRGITRHYPHTPGIDAAGVVVESTDPTIAVGSEVLVVGYDLGMNTSGGLAEFIRVPASWVIPKPNAMTFKQAMQWGTAGFTAALCLEKLARIAQGDHRRMIVTGAGGGVGSVAALLAAQLGYEVTGVTEKNGIANTLKNAGVTDIISRQSIMVDEEKVFAKPRWDVAVDVVGGAVLTSVIKQLYPQGSVACCGLVGGTTLPLTVYPFILRGINLLGIDSAELALSHKIALWNKLANEWSLSTLDAITQEISLDEVPQTLRAFIDASVQGRVVVKIV